MVTSFREEKKNSFSPYFCLSWTRTARWHLRRPWESWSWHSIMSPFLRRLMRVGRWKNVRVRTLIFFWVIWHNSFCNVHLCIYCSTKLNGSTVGWFMCVRWVFFFVLARPWNDGLFFEFLHTLHNDNKNGYDENDWLFSRNCVVCLQRTSRSSPYDVRSNVNG